MSERAQAQTKKSSTPSLPSFTSVRSGILQRKCSCGGAAGVDGECVECRKKRLQRRASNSVEPTTVPFIVHEVLRSPGQPLDPATRAFMELRFGHDFSQVRVHADAKAAESARAVNALAYTVGKDIAFGISQYSPETQEGRRLLAHELTHVMQQSNAGPDLALQIVAPSDAMEGQAEQVATAVAGHNLTVETALLPHGRALMRDLAQEPPQNVPAQRELTVAQVQAAIRYNRASYNEESTRLIQDIVGGPKTGRFNEQTVRLVALIQRQYGLVPADGKVGPDTYDFLIRELQVEAVTPGSCLTLFQIVGPQPLAFFRTSPNQGLINSRFEVHARFDPRCNCSDFEYRQFIAGHVELLEDAQPGITPPARSGCAVLDSVLPDMWVWNMDGCFPIPGGGLSRHMREDGDTAVPAGMAGRRYGHRSARPNPSDNRDQYLSDRASGCIYKAFDVPDLAPVPATPGDAGDVYDWDMRFRGVIQRSDGTIVDEKWWNIINTITIS